MLLFLHMKDKGLLLVFFIALLATTRDIQVFASNPAGGYGMNMGGGPPLSNYNQFGSIPPSSTGSPGGIPLGNDMHAGISNNPYPQSTLPPTYPQSPMNIPPFQSMPSSNLPYGGGMSAPRQAPSSQFPSLSLAPPMHPSPKSKNDHDSLKLELKMMDKIKEAERQMRVAEAERHRAEQGKAQALYQQQIAERQRRKAEEEKIKAENQVQRAVQEMQRRANSQVGHLSKKIQKLMDDLAQLQGERRARERMEQERRQQQQEIRRQQELEQKLEKKFARMFHLTPHHRRHRLAVGTEPSAVKVLEAMLKAALTTIRPSLKPYLREAEDRLPLNVPRVDRRLPYFVDSPSNPLFDDSYMGVGPSSSLYSYSEGPINTFRSKRNRRLTRHREDPIDY